jgi:hypothetical protein
MDIDFQLGTNVRVFVSYRRERQDLRRTFVDVVFDDVMREITYVWTDDQIDPGEKWDDEIRSCLMRSDIILLLLTPEFLESKYCTDFEGRAALKQAAAGRAKVFAVLLEECDFRSKGFGDVELLSDGGRPLRSSPDAKKALEEIRLRLMYVAYEWFEQRHGEITKGVMREECELIARHARGNALVGGMSFGNFYRRSRPMRLAAYHELVRARRSPPGGWRIDNVGVELEHRRKERRDREFLLLRQSIEKMASETIARKRAATPAEESESDDEPESNDESELDEESEPGGRYALEDAVLAEMEERLERSEREAKEQVGTPLLLLAIFHSEDEEVWSDLLATMLDEGLDDLCRIRACRIDDDTSEWRAAVVEARVVLPLLTAHFVATPAVAELRAALRVRDIPIYPIQIEDLGSEAGGFEEPQFLPQHGAVETWPVDTAAYQNVARNLIQRLVHREFHSGLPPLKNAGWDTSGGMFLTWIKWQPRFSLIAAFVVWMIGGRWAFGVAAVALTVVPIWLAWVLLYGEERNVRRYVESLPEGAWRKISGSITSRLITASLVALALFTALLAISVESARESSHALMTFLDVGLVGGIAFGLLGFLATRRKRLKVLQKRLTPEPMIGSVRFHDGVLTVRFPFVNASKEPTGAIGNIRNRAPRTAEGSHLVMQFRPASLARLGVETVVFTAIAWVVFAGLLARFSAFPLRLPLAGFIMLFVEGFLLDTYEQFNIHREIRSSDDSLWRRLKYAWMRRLYHPVLIPLWIWLIAVAVVDVVAWVFSSPLAPPMLSCVLVAAITAAVKFTSRYFQTPFVKT